MNRISFDELNQWTERQGGIISDEGFFDAEEAFEEEGVQFHQGDYSVNTLNVSPCVVVDGNLEVSDEITWEFERGLLIVNGDMRCKTFDFPFAAVITGNLYAEQIRINSCCDYYLTVGGDVHAKSLIEDGHCITVKGEANSPFIRSYVHILNIGGQQIERSEEEDDETD